MTRMASSLSLAPRDRHETHRVATPLELFFDLASVIAIASAASGLHHALSAGHPAEGLVGYAFGFFAMWWAWMNYTWFASAYGNDGVLFRLVTMLIIFGSLVMAADMPDMFGREHFYTVLAGYLIMRVGMISLWLMAAYGDPARRTTALRYALGIALAQIYWSVIIIFAQPGNFFFSALFGLGVVFELSVPALAERAGQTTWHRHHIMERYGLLNIIVLGEGLLASVLAIRAAEESFSLASPMVHTAIAAAVVFFCFWSLYFIAEEHLSRETLHRALVWGYGHVAIFAAGAACGAGFGVLVDILTGHASVSLRIGDIAVGVPIAIYLLGLWFVRDRYSMRGAWKWLLPAAAALILAIALAAPAALELMTIALVLCTAIRRYASSHGGVHGTESRHGH
jgi:low temperature requirement protein LtrA